jgi:hypothetical protein
MLRLENAGQVPSSDQTVSLRDVSAALTYTSEVFGAPGMSATGHRGPIFTTALTRAARF